MYQSPPPTRGPRSSLVHRRPGLPAALVTLVVGAPPVTAALVAPAAPAPSVAAAPPGPEVRDDALGVTYPLPEGWTEMPREGLIAGLGSGASTTPPGGGSAMLAVGLLDASIFASAGPTLPEVARRLSSDFGAIRPRTAVTCTSP